MIICTVKYSVKPGTRDKVLQWSKDIRVFARTCKGNIEYCPTASPYNENEMVSFEKWESKDDLMAYMASQECKTFQGNRNQYLVKGTMVAQIYEAKEIQVITY